MRQIRKAIIAAVLIAAALTIGAFAESSVSLGVTTEALNQRTAANTSAKIVTTMPQNAVVLVINDGTSMPADWVKIQYKGTIGYAAKQWLAIDDTKTAALGQGTLTTDYVNFRAEPNTNATIHQMLRKNSNVEITGISSGWFKATYNGVEGYIYPEFIKVSNVNLAASALTVATVQAPAASTETLTETVAPMVETPAETTEQTAVTQNKGVLNTNYVNFRAEANTTSTVLHMFTKNDVVDINQVIGDWVKATHNGTTGYIFAEYVTLTTEDGVADVQAANNVVSEKGLAVVNKAKQYLGVPYVYGGASPSGFDCSGLVYYVYKQMGVTINRGATSQLSNGTAVSKGDLQPGDIVFFRDTRRASSGATHSGIYVGDNKFIHSPSAGQTVCITSLSSNYYAKYYLTARRIFD